MIQKRLKTGDGAPEVYKNKYYGKFLESFKGNAKKINKYMGYKLVRVGEIMRIADANKLIEEAEIRGDLH